MPQRFVAGSEIAQSEELIGRSLAARAEELRARRDRLMQLRITSQDEEVFEDGEEQPIRFSRSEFDEHPVQGPSKVSRTMPRIRRYVVFASLATVLIAMAGGGWASVKIARKLNRNSIEIEHLSDQVRTQRELAGLIAEERDMLRADLIEAREARARAEGQVLAITGSQSPVRRTTADARGQ